MLYVIMLAKYDNSAMSGDCGDWISTNGHSLQWSCQLIHHSHNVLTESSLLSEFNGNDQIRVLEYATAKSRRNL